MKLIAKFIIAVVLSLMVAQVSNVWSRVEAQEWGIPLSTNPCRVEFLNKKGEITSNVTNDSHFYRSVKYDCMSGSYSLRIYRNPPNVALGTHACQAPDCVKRAGLPLFRGTEIKALLENSFGMEIGEGESVTFYIALEGNQPDEKPFRNFTAINFHNESLPFGAIDAVCGSNVISAGQLDSQIALGDTNAYNRLNAYCPAECPLAKSGEYYYCGEPRFGDSIYEVQLCSHILDGEMKARCRDCTGYWSAVGCINTDSIGSMIGVAIKIGVGVAGGLALAFMIFASMTMSTSAGNPERLKAAQEMFTSAIVGLLVVLFSVIGLEVLGIGILNLPGFLQ